MVHSYWPRLCFCTPAITITGEVSERRLPFNDQMYVMSEDLSDTSEHVSVT